MPCVCLANTFARWKSLKPVKTTARQEPLKPDMSVAERGIFSENETLHVPHDRPASPVIVGAGSVRMTRADLINAESRLGSTIFGPIPAGHRREFFHDQANVWIWHEHWYDGQHNPHQMTVRYEVRTSGIYKKVAKGRYLRLEGEELENFRRATHAYLYVIKKNLYSRTPRLMKLAKPEDSPVFRVPAKNTANN